MKLKIALDSVFAIRGHPYPSVILLKLHQPDTRQWIGRLFAGLGGGVISRGLFVSGGFLCLRAGRASSDDTDCRGKNTARNELTVSHNTDDHDLTPLACAKINDFGYEPLLELLALPRQRGKHSVGNQRCCLIEPP